jgi:hypothetical protein
MKIFTLGWQPVKNGPPSTTQSGRRQARKLPCCLAAGYIQGVKCLANTWGGPDAATTAISISAAKYTLSAAAQHTQETCSKIIPGMQQCTGFHTQQDPQATSPLAHSPHPASSKLRQAKVTYIVLFRGADQHLLEAQHPQPAIPAPATPNVRTHCVCLVIAQGPAFVAFHTPCKVSLSARAATAAR